MYYKLVRLDPLDKYLQIYRSKDIILPCKTISAERITLTIYTKSKILIHNVNESMKKNKTEKHKTHKNRLKVIKFIKTLNHLIHKTGWNTRNNINSENILILKIHLKELFDKVFK